MSSKILSICIPTYNRCEILDKTLYNLISNPEFDDKIIEIIVSDNCSTDRTKEVVLKYQKVKYYRNDKNQSFYNLTTVLSYAKGKYIKLFNDTFIFMPNSLSIMLSRIRNHDDTNFNLFFYPNFFANKNTFKILHSIPKFLKECSYFTTWTLSIGFWKKDFDQLTNKNRYAELHLPQLEWMYGIVKNGKPTIIYFENFIDITPPNNKGGYNVFKTFAFDYLEIIKNEKINLFTYEIEKYRLSRYFLYTWLVTLLINDKEAYSFDTKGVFKIIFKKYWYEPYFYVMCIFFSIKKLKNYFKKLNISLNETIN